MGGGASRGTKKHAVQQAARLSGKVVIFSRKDETKKDKKEARLRDIGKAGEASDHVSPSKTPASSKKAKCLCICDLDYVADFKVGDKVQVKIENNFEQKKRRRATFNVRNAPVFFQNDEKYEPITSKFVPNIHKRHSKRTKDEKSDADADAVAVAPPNTESTAQPTTAPVVAQNNLAMQRPGTAVLATTVTGTFFWADSVIMKVQLDPDHICKVQDTWVIYRVKFTDPAHPHLLDTEAKHVKPIRIRRKPREFKVSKAMSLKEKNDLMYEEFLREKEEREKRMADVELRQSLRAATEEKNEAHFLENVQKLMTEDRGTNIFNSSNDLYYEAAEKLDDIKKEQRQREFAKYQEDLDKARKDLLAKSSMQDIAGAWVRFFNTSTNKKASGTDVDHDSIFYWYNTITEATSFTRPEGYTTPRRAPGKGGSKWCIRSTILANMPPRLRATLMIQSAVRGWEGRRKAHVQMAEHNLKEALKVAKETKDRAALLQAIQTALENGMDDDCDTYYEAGILLDDLEHGTENASEESTTDRSLLSGDSYNDADIDKFLYGELDLEDDAKDPSATDDDDTLGNYDDADIDKFLFGDDDDKEHADLYKFDDI